MATTSSFSKGCFVFKANPQKSGRSPRKKTKKSAIVDTNDDLNASSLFAKSDKSSMEIRLDSYKKIWSATKKKSEEIISDSHKQLLHDVKTFVSENAGTGQSSIPTALISLGVNLPDHAAFFSLLDTTLKTNVSPFVAMLNSKECPSLKNMVLKTIQKLTSCDSIDDEVEKDEEDDEDDVIVPIKPRSKVKTFANLATWYSNVVMKTPLIIILQDLESFGTQQLQDFVLLCRENRVRNKLPIQFIMGIATTVALQQQLHHRTSVCLATKSFQSRPSVVLLNHLIEQLFMKSSVLKLGPRLMQLLLDGFLYHDLSLNSFMMRVHLIIMQHYITLPVSSLCCSVSELKNRIKQLNVTDLDLYRQLPSFMKFIEKNRSKISLLTDDKEFRLFLQKSLEALNTYSKNFSLSCRIIHSLSDGMPDALFGKSLREVYVNLLIGGESEDWEQFLRLLNVSSAHELRTRIEAALTTLKECDSSGSLSDFSTSLVLFSEELLRLEESKKSDAVSSPKSQNVFVPQGKKLDKFELKAQLMATAKQVRTTSEFDEVKSEIITWLNSELASRLKSPSTLVFHEIFYAGSQVQSNWDIVPWMRRQVQPVPRVAISKALSNPASYLGCSCCSLTGQETQVLSSMPDLCIVYKLHTECGRLINLYDWMLSFNAIQKKDDEDDNEEIEPIIQARFIRAVAQLQLLGFIQSSKRKTDHVARLTWGV
ncbi:origin recognition complex subunit 3-like [Daphnia pulex]|uniref:origin recognition complex subunit 3-like n=1 Tax=Daphnia pulex TaxID=6669 RepID=UPI001EE145E6|nr:origin recognition complex subunit 3-like [Daphnia pulex]